MASCAGACLLTVSYTHLDVYKRQVHARYYDDAGYLYHKHELEEGLKRRAEPEWFL